MNTDLLLLNHSEDASITQRKFTILTETRQITDCPICYSFPKPNITENIELKLRFSERKCPACGKHCGKPALLDLFSGAGGAARGYQKAGFCVLGVDIKAQPHYAGCRFVQADALTYPLEGFDAYHASPPCQYYTRLRHLPWLKGREYWRSVPPTLEILSRLTHPWVLENVEDCWDMPESVVICGSSIGLNLYRHRRFLMTFPILLYPHQKHKGVIVPGRATLGQRHHGQQGFQEINRNSVCGKSGYAGDVERRKVVMGIDWMSGSELAQAIPPAYTEYIGKYLMQAVRGSPALPRESKKP